GSVAPASIGKASGTFNTLRQLGGVFGVALLVAVFTGSGSYASPALFSDGFTAAIGVAAGLSLLGAAAGVAPPGRARMPGRTVPRMPPQAAPNYPSRGS